MKLIDKDALVAEIKERIEGLKDCHADTIEGYAGEISGLKRLLETIDNFEVKEMSNIWHTISDNDVDLPKVGDVICCITNGRVISGDYRLNKFYGKVNNGYDNPIEKGDKWCFLSDFLNSVVEAKEVDLDFTKEVDAWVRDNGDTNGFFSVQELAKHFYELGIKAQKGENNDR